MDNKPETSRWADRQYISELGMRSKDFDGPTDTFVPNRLLFSFFFFCSISRFRLFGVVPVALARHLKRHQRRRIPGTPKASTPKRLQGQLLGPDLRNFVESGGTTITLVMRVFFTS